MFRGSGLGHKHSLGLSWENCNIFRGLLVLDPESRDVSNCHPYQFLEICIPLCNDLIGLIQKGHLNILLLSDEEKDWPGPTGPAAKSVFWYDKDKYLKKCIFAAHKITTKQAHFPFSNNWIDFGIFIFSGSVSWLLSHYSVNLISTVKIHFYRIKSTGNLWPFPTKSNGLKFLKLFLNF